MPHTGNSTPPPTTGDKTDFFNVSYDNLARKDTLSHRWQGGGGKAKYSKYVSWIPTYNGQEANILEIEPGRWGAVASLLAKQIREGHPDEKGKTRVSLSDAEKRAVYAWIDLNCPYYGTSDSNYRDNRGCRQALPPDLDKTVVDVAKRRCVECHKEVKETFSLPNTFCVRIDNPERNGFLMAPLSKEAGGTQKCGKAVFADTQDDDYQKILQLFGPLKIMLAQRPRLDMVDLDAQKATP